LKPTAIEALIPLRASALIFSSYQGRIIKREEYGAKAQKINKQSRVRWLKPTAIEAICLKEYRIKAETFCKKLQS
jgi:hypothetical protein